MQGLQPGKQYHQGAQTAQLQGEQGGTPPLPARGTQSQALQQTDVICRSCLTDLQGQLKLIC